MSILLVGGHDRMHREYQKIGKAHGHKLKVFTQMSAKFNKAIGCPDAMVIFTNTVSHKMVKAANTEAKKKNIPIYRVHTSSGTALKNTLSEINTVYAS